MSFKANGMGFTGIAVGVIFLASCGDERLHISEYIAENNSNHTLEIISMGGCFKEELTADPGERVVPYSQATEPGTFGEMLAKSRIPPSSSGLNGVAAFFRNEVDERQLVGLWKTPFSVAPIFTYEGEDKAGKDTHYRYVMSFDDANLDFNLRVPFNYYWFANDSSEELSVTSKMRRPLQPVPDYSVTNLIVSPGEKVLLAGLDHSISLSDCPEFRSREPYYVFETIAVTIDSRGPRPILSDRGFNQYFVSENIVDPTSNVTDFHHTMTITEMMASP